MHHVDKRRQRDSAVREVSEQRRLAHAVTTDESILDTIVQREHRMVEQFLLARAHPDAANLDVHLHARALGRVWPRALVEGKLGGSHQNPIELRIRRLHNSLFLDTLLGRRAALDTSLGLGARTALVLHTAHTRALHCRLAALRLRLLTLVAVALIATIATIATIAATSLTTLSLAALPLSLFRLCLRCFSLLCRHFCRLLLGERCPLLLHHGLLLLLAQLLGHELVHALVYQSTFLATHAPAQHAFPLVFIHLRVELAQCRRLQPLRLVLAKLAHRCFRRRRLGESCTLHCLAKWR